MAKRVPKPFDPGDPFDAMAENFRVQTCKIALEAERAALFREMPLDQQFTCLVCGILTGLVGVGYAYVEPDGREAVRAAIRNFVDDAGRNVESIEKHHGAERRNG